MGIKWILLASGLLALGGCAHSSASGRVYPRYQTRTAYQVQYGEVIAVRPVEIEGYSTIIGRFGGAIVGEAIGGTVNGRGGRRVARAVGGVAGAVVGEAVERELTAETGLEVTVDLSNGSSIAVVQAADIVFVPGDRARVLFGPEGSARVTRP
jgi:outer membrane lipoprotein SlyB